MGGTGVEVPYTVSRHPRSIGLTPQYENAFAVLLDGFSDLAFQFLNSLLELTDDLMAEGHIVAK